MEMQPFAAGLGEEMFAVPPHARERTAAQAARERFRADLTQDALIENGDAGDRLLQGVLREVPRVQLDFGQLRQSCS
jgi:hypothetical protein